MNNSRLDSPFQQVAVIRQGQKIQQKTPLPDWAKDLLENY